MLCPDRSDDGRVPGGDERLLGQHERGPVLDQLVQRDLGPAPPNTSTTTATTCQGLVVGVLPSGLPACPPICPPSPCDHVVVELSGLVELQHQRLGGQVRQQEVVHRHLPTTIHHKQHESGPARPTPSLGPACLAVGRQAGMVVGGWVGASVPCRWWRSRTWGCCPARTASPAGSTSIRSRQASPSSASMAVRGAGWVSRECVCVPGSRSRRSRRA